MRTLRWMRRHPGLAAEIGAYGAWLLVDLVFAAVGGAALNLVAGTVVPLLVLRRRQEGADLVRVAALALGASLVLSTISLAVVGTPTASDLSFAEQLSLAVLVVAVLRTCPLPAALAVTMVGALAIVGSAALRTGGGTEAAYAVLSALGWGGAVGIGLLLRDAETGRRASLEEVRSAERMELARELHDVVAHHVTGIIVAAQAASVVARRSPDDVERALAAIENAGTDAMSAMRSMVGVLRGDDEGARTPGAELGGLDTLVARFDPDRHVAHLHTDPGLAQAVLPAGVAATGYRVVQEALTNVRRHAPAASTVEIDVRIREEALLVSVRNDGVPAPATGPLAQDGFGLVGMAERVAALDGALTAGATAPGVWTVAARLPLGRAR